MQLEDRYEIFVSYSHSQYSIATIIAQSIRATGKSVFRDKDSIKPGEIWPDEIVKALSNCKFFYLFWCSNAAKSMDIKEEYLIALFLKKQIIPLILDDTELPTKIKNYQWIDLRSIVNPIPKVNTEKIPTKQIKNSYRLPISRKRKIENVFSIFSAKPCAANSRIEIQPSPAARALLSDALTWPTSKARPWSFPPM